MNLENLGKLILAFAVILFVVGAVVYLLGKVTPLPRLPGDILYRRGNFTFYFPLGASILISIALTAVLNLILFILRR